MIHGILFGGCGFGSIELTLNWCMEWAYALMACLHNNIFLFSLSVQAYTLCTCMECEVELLFIQYNMVDKAVNECMKNFGTIDILINGGAFLSALNETERFLF